MNVFDITLWFLHYEFYNIRNRFKIISCIKQALHYLFLKKKVYRWIHDDPMVENQINLWLIRILRNESKSLRILNINKIVIIIK